MGDLVFFRVQVLGVVRGLGRCDWLKFGALHNNEKARRKIKARLKKFDVTVKKGRKKI